MWTPFPGNQAAAFSADWCDELFYGGERGGGKSDLQLGYQEDAALRYDGKSRGIMFRKTYPELEELQSRACEVFPTEGAIYKTKPSSGYPFSNCWYWPNGATVKMRFIETEQDYGKYHGHQYTHISFDEVTEYASPLGLLKMLSTLRSAHGVPCTMRATGNPGGVGHGWVKERYVKNGRFIPFKDPDTGFIRMFVPSKTSDNRALMESDPNYRARLLAATGGNEALRRAWLEGDWDIVAGAFFSNWNPHRHIISPIPIPSHWMRFRSGDWGSARPFSFGWWAVVGEETTLPTGLILPVGCLIRYREWYGCKVDNAGQLLPNTGLKFHAELVGERLAEMEQYDPKLSYGVIDPAAFTEDGGPSIQERIYTGSKQKIIFIKADNARVGRMGHLAGWDLLQSRLAGIDEQRPMIVTFSTCHHSIRTIPTLQHDSTNIEDLDTDGEDHAADDWRYACASRPWVRSEEKPSSIKWPQDRTINQLMAHARNLRQSREEM